MSLEKLKSAYANITLPNDNLKKEGKDVNNNMRPLDKTTPDINGGVGLDLTKMVSEFSIQNSPQMVDSMNNEKASGFTPNYDKSLFTGIEGKKPSITFNGNTLAYTDRNVEWPGPVDFMSNQKVGGFTLDSTHKSPSLYKGVVDGEKPISTWVNGLNVGGSLFGIDEPKKDFNFIWNDNKQINYTLGDVDFPGPVDFQTIIGMWTTQLTGLNFPDGFTLGMNESELVKGYQTMTLQGEDYRNTNKYNIGNYSFTDVPGTSGVNDFYIGFNPVTTPSQYAGIPETYDGTWNTTGMATNYFDSKHTNNPIYNDFPGPVDFMSGMSLHPASLAQSGSITGFTNNYNPGMFGGWSVGNPEGDSKLLGMWNTDFLPNEMLTSLWTGYNYNNTVQFGQAVDFMSGVNSYYPTIDPSVPGFNLNFNEGGYTEGIGLGGSKYLNIPTGTHTAYGSSLSFTDTEGDIGVDFMTGMSHHELSLANSGSISGFNIKYNPGQFGGWTPDNPQGDSKLLGLWDTQYGQGEILTSMWSGYTDENNNTVDFPGPIGDFSLNFNPNFPGGYSTENPIGDTKYDLTDDGSVITDMYSSTIDDEIVNFSQENLFDNQKILLRSGVEVDKWKGSSQGGQLSPQFDVLYNTLPWIQSAKDAKYGGPIQDGSNINNLDRFNPKADIWNDGARIGNTNPSLTLNNSSLLRLSTLSQNPISTDYGGSNEPYIIDHLGNVDDNFVGFSVPVTRMKKDVIRISKFLTSVKGGQFISNQNFLGQFQQYRTFYDPLSTLLNISSPKKGLGTLLQTYSRDEGLLGTIAGGVGTHRTYSEWLDERALGYDQWGSSTGNTFNLNLFQPGEEKTSETTTANPAPSTYAEKELRHTPMAFKGYDLLASGVEFFTNLLVPGGTGGGKAIDPAGITKESGIDSRKNMNVSIDSRRSPLGDIGKGDLHTLTPAITDASVVEKQTDGMPFYFKDLRDNKIITFRAYIEGLSETISPTWNSEEYIGRSEPVYTYKNAEREINFSLKLFAGTKDELNMIYSKMNRLTSLAYPEYIAQEEVTNNPNPNTQVGTLKIGTPGAKTRMKPPLCQLRLGNLFGTNGNLLSGFIKSLSYNFPDNAPWEIKAGEIVPKYIEAELGFQVIHSKVPELNTANINHFYGIHQIQQTTSTSTDSNVDNQTSETEKNVFLEGAGVGGGGLNNFNLNS